jgi:hypothetical protein
MQSMAVMQGIAAQLQSIHLFPARCIDTDSTQVDR